MQFNSYSYLLLLVLAAAAFWILPTSWRRWYVLSLSLLFYATWNPLFALLPIAICVSTYLCARLMQADTARAALKSVEFNRGYSVINAPADGVVLRKLSQERELVPAAQAVLIVSSHGRGYVVKAALSDRQLV